MPSPDLLDAVRNTVDSASDALDERNAAIRAAADDGHSLRAIAAAARLSHSGVAKIVNEAAA